MSQPKEEPAVPTVPAVESKDAPDRPDQEQPALETKDDAQEVPATAPDSPVAAPQGNFWYDRLGRRVIRFGRPVSFKGTNRGTYIEVDEDVLREVFVENTPQPLFVQVYTKGQQLVPAAAEALDKG
jgi:hypothetical protein